MNDPVLPRHIIEKFERRWATQHPRGNDRAHGEVSLENDLPAPFPPQPGAILPAVPPAPHC
jgi:hypothetical protein